MPTQHKLSTAELLYARALQMGLQPVWLLPDALFAVTTKGGDRYVHYAKSTINSQLSSSLTGNKLTTRLVLEHHGLPSIPYCNPANQAEAEQFLRTHKKIIVKPLKGSNSHDVHIVESPAQLPAAISSYILEEYVPGREMRYLVLDGAVIGVHRSDYGVSVAEDRTLERISYPETGWDDELVALSLEVARVFGLRYAAVDYLISREGKPRILEVNSSPGMKWFHAPTSGPVVDVARLFLEAMFADRTPAVSAIQSPVSSVRPALAYN